MAPFSLPLSVAAATIQLLLISQWSGIDAIKNPATSRRRRNGGRSVDNNDLHQKRNLVRGQAWVDQQLRGDVTDTVDVTDNIFVRSSHAVDDECTCDRRRRRLGIGQSPCICDDDNDERVSTPPSGTPVASGGGKGVSYYIYGKGSKSSSFYGKGSSNTSRSSSSDESVVGGSSSDESYYSSNYTEGKGKGKGKGRGKGKGAAYYGKGVNNESYYYYRYTKKSKDSKSRKRDKSKGKGFRYDDDYVYPTSPPTPRPTTSPAPSKIPTPSNIPTPSKIPTSSFEPTPKPNTKPTRNPTGNEDSCSVSSLGIYGQTNGPSEEFRFRYQALVIKSVSVAELDQDIIPKIEVDMGNKLLPRLFPDDCNTPGKVTVRSIGNRKIIDDAPPQRTRHLQYKRQTDSNQLTGMSIKPLDFVDQKAQCKGFEESIFASCYVINGIIVVYFKNTPGVIDRFQVNNIIQQTITSGDLTEADNRLLGISFLDLVENPDPPPEDPGNWLFNVAWWILLLISLGILAVLVTMLVIFSFCCKRFRNNRQRPNPQSGPRPNSAIAPVQNSNADRNSNAKANPNDNISISSGSSSSSSSNGNNISGGGVVGSNSSIATSENLSFDNGGVTKSSLNDPTNNEYQYHSDDHISQSLLPSTEEPIEEELQEDVSSGNIRYDMLQQSSSSGNNKENDPLYMPDRDSQYNGVSYEDQIYENNNAQAMVPYKPNPNQYRDDPASQHSKSDSFDRVQKGSQRRVTYDESSTGHSRSRSLSRKDQEFRELGERMVSPKTPMKASSNNSTPENYSSDIYSATSRQMSYQSEEVIEEEEDEDESSYEDVEEEYEIEYASQSEGLVDEVIEQPESAYEEVWVDENDPTFSNSNINSSSQTNSNSNTYTNPTSTSYSSSNSNSSSSSKSSTSYSGSGGSNSKEGQTPLPFLAHNAQLQQQSKITSFDTLRNKWEQV